jgi:hypothetical protein
VSDRHAQPDWIGGGSESRQMMQHAASTDEAIRQNGDSDGIKSSNGNKKTPYR